MAAGGASARQRSPLRGVALGALERSGMIRQFSDLRDQLEVREECDVCVVGSGCGGASVAALLSERGRKGVFLERYGNNVGGASVHYWADSYRTPPDRLKQWRDEFGIEGHGEDVLVPHFERIE